MKAKRAKVQIARDALLKSATADHFEVQAIEHSVTEETGYRAALACDVLFSCVDRPWPRSVLNHIAYAHLIPVIDGGVAVSRLPDGRMRGADWKAHAVSPSHRCMSCLEQYDSGLVDVDRSGLLDDPSYLDSLPDDHPIKNNVNVFTFSLNAASLEVLNLVQLVVAPSGVGARYRQAFHFPACAMDNDASLCEPNCPYPGLVANGDTQAVPGVGRHEAAEKARAKRRATGSPRAGE